MKLKPRTKTRKIQKRTTNKPRTNKKGTDELHRKCRPTRFEDVIGQDAAVQLLQQRAKQKSLPHTLLLTGPPGVGKTTLGRIVASHVECGPRDYTELNNADYRGIDAVRVIRRGVNMAPMSGASRVYLLDECHRLTKEAQDAFLKLTEEPPDHTYFILCTTDPQKLSETFHQRFFPVRLYPLDIRSLTKLVERTCKQERIELDEEVQELLVEHSEGSARKTLVLLDKVRTIETTEEQITTIQSGELKAQVFDIARKLIKPQTKWGDIRPLLEALKDEDAEQIRWMILGYARSVMLGRSSPKMYEQAHQMLEAFRDHFYDCKFAGVVAGCWEVIQK